MCGEKSSCESHTASILGSPPHVRGKAGKLKMRYAINRITPACAGKRCRLTVCLLRTRDHPRMCGEKGALGKYIAAIEGSPPHVRGKALPPGWHGLRYGITPACAGKSRCRFSACTSYWDHPRMCGEKTGVIRRVRCGGGSPPHVRGKGS